MALSDFLPTRRGRGQMAGRGFEWPEMSSLQREMNRLFEDFYGDIDLSPSRVFEKPMRFTPSIDIKETDKNITVTAELPGMEQKDISVSLKEDCIILAGERKEEKKEEDEQYFHREMSYGSFRRIIPLAANIDRDKVDAEFKNGVLHITLPKIAGAETEKTKKIEIKS